jgi:hypothetical protein
MNSAPAPVSSQPAMLLPFQNNMPMPISNGMSVMPNVLGP